MKQWPFYQVDAFTDVPFRGNPAAVCLCDAWPDDTILLAIAQENNLAETAFVKAEGDDFALRWFTPQREVDLCGHATLASAHVLFVEQGYTRPTIRFFTKESGMLTVQREAAGRYCLDFPMRPAEVCEEPPAGLVPALGSVQPQEIYQFSRNYYLIYADAAELSAMTPDYAALGKLDKRACVSAPADTGATCDFVSRFFTPGSGYNEDPVTGSTHCTLVPYWAKRLGKTELRARQLSPRGGTLHCSLQGDRVAISGTAVTVISGKFYVPAAR